MNNMNRLLPIALTTSLLVIAFSLYTYLDKAQLYENIVAITILTNMAAHFLPALVLRKFQNAGNSFARTLVGILVPSIISIAIYVGFVSVFNILTVPNFLRNISLFQFIIVNFLIQLAYALTSALIATIVLKIFFRQDYRPHKEQDCADPPSRPRL